MAAPAERSVLAWDFLMLGQTAKASRWASRRRRRSHHLRSTTTSWRRSMVREGKGEFDRIVDRWRHHWRDSLRW